jgi:hypothetical protein
LGAGGGTGGRGAGCDVGGFLRLSNNCCRPAAVAVAAISIISTKQIGLISWVPIQFDNNYSWHLVELPNDNQRVLDIQVGLVDTFVEYKLDSVGSQPVAVWLHTQ